MLPFINTVNTESVDAPHPRSTVGEAARRRDECKALAGKAPDRWRIVNTPREGNAAGADAAALECERMYESEHLGCARRSAAMNPNLRKRRESRTGGAHPSPPGDARYRGDAL